MTLTTLEAAILAAELSAFAVAFCAAVVVQIRRAGEPVRRGRHAAPPTPPPSVAEPDPGPRRLAPDWREQIALPGPEPVLVRPYVARHLGIGAAR